MKRIIASLTAVILIALIIAACSDNMSTETPSTTGTSLKGTGKTEVYCANNLYPSISNYTPSTIMSYNDCNLGGTERSITAGEAAILWRTYVMNPDPNAIDGRLYDQECDGIDEGWEFTVTASQEGGHPKISWPFVYCHYYKITRTVNGVSTTVQFNNKGVTPESAYTSEANPSYTDASINLNEEHDLITYKVSCITFTSAGLTAQTTYPSTRLAMPVNFWINPTSTSSTSTIVTLFWSVPSDQNVTGYEIYRKYETETDYTLIQTITSRTTTNALNSISFARRADAFVFYKMRSVDSANGRYSSFTDVKTCECTVCQ